MLQRLRKNEVGAFLKIELKLKIFCPSAQKNKGFKPGRMANSPGLLIMGLE
jgi:hypothetical protein